MDQLATRARVPAPQLAQRLAAAEQLDDTVLPVGACLDHLGTDSGKSPDQRLSATAWTGRTRR